MDWQPIETAPKDGTAFVATDGYYAFRTMAKQHYLLWPHEPGGPTFQTLWNKEDEGSSFPWRPTHWMPLPAPPAPTQETPNE